MMMSVSTTHVTQQQSQCIPTNQTPLQSSDSTLNMIQESNNKKLTLEQKQQHQQPSLTVLKIDASQLFSMLMTHYKLNIMDRSAIEKSKIMLNEHDSAVNTKLASLSSIMVFSILNQLNPELLYQFWNEKKEVYELFQAHCLQVLNCSRIQSNIVILGLFYLSKVKCIHLVGQEHMLWAACLVLAHKYLDEKVYLNIHSAAIHRMSLTDLNIWERKVLLALDYKLYIPVNEFERWKINLKQFIHIAIRKIKSITTTSASSDVQQTFIKTSDDANVESCADYATSSLPSSSSSSLSLPSTPIVNQDHAHSRSRSDDIHHGFMTCAQFSHSLHDGIHTCEISKKDKSFTHPYYNPNDLEYHSYSSCSHFSLNEKPLTTGPIRSPKHKCLSKFKKG